MEKVHTIFKSLLQSAAEGIVMVNRYGRIILANPKAEELFGYQENELLGHQVEILLPERLRKTHVVQRNTYLTAPCNRPGGAGFDLVARKKDGSEFPVEISLSYAGSGDDLVVMATIIDISKRKQLEKDKEQLMEQRIEELEQTLGTLESIAMHPETPVTARIMGIIPLREAVPAEFKRLVEDYSEVMDKVIDCRVFKMDCNIANTIDELGSRLGFMKATPRDVVDIHSEMLRNKREISSAAKMRGYIEEGHFLLLDLIGRLANYYRNRSFGVTEQKTK